MNVHVSKALFIHAALPLIPCHVQGRKTEKKLVEKVSLRGADNSIVQ
jgi:hypothetical protein